MNLFEVYERDMESSSIKRSVYFDQVPLQVFRAIYKELVSEMPIYHCSELKFAVDIKYLYLMKDRGKR